MAGSDELTGEGPQTSSPGIPARVFANVFTWVIGTPFFALLLMIPLYGFVEAGMLPGSFWNVEQIVYFAAVFVGLLLLLTAGEEVNHAE